MDARNWDPGKGTDATLATMIYTRNVGSRLRQLPTHSPKMKSACLRNSHQNQIFIENLRQAYKGLLLPVQRDGV